MQESSAPGPFPASPHPLRLRPTSGPRGFNQTELVGPWDRARGSQRVSARLLDMQLGGEGVEAAKPTARET